MPLHMAVLLRGCPGPWLLVAHDQVVHEACVTVAIADAAAAFALVAHRALSAYKRRAFGLLAVPCGCGRVSPGAATGQRRPRRRCLRVRGEVASAQARGERVPLQCRSVGRERHAVENLERGSSRHRPLRVDESKPPACGLERCDSGAPLSATRALGSAYTVRA